MRTRLRGRWSCVTLRHSGFATAKAADARYWDANWLDFLGLYWTAADLAGVNPKSTTMRVDGYPLTCMAAEPRTTSTGTGTGTWGVTSTGIPGSVQVTAGANDTARRPARRGSHRPPARP